MWGGARCLVERTAPSGIAMGQGVPEPPNVTKQSWRLLRTVAQIRDVIPGHRTEHCSVTKAWLLLPYLEVGKGRRRLDSSPLFIYKCSE